MRGRGYRQPNDGRRVRGAPVHGGPNRSRSTARRTLDWVREGQYRGAGEIVLNCMASDGVRQGYDVEQLAQVRDVCRVPLIASGGAGSMEHFVEVFARARVDGALAARGNWLTGWD